MRPGGGVRFFRLLHPAAAVLAVVRVGGIDRAAGAAPAGRSHALAHVPGASEAQDQRENGRQEEQSRCKSAALAEGSGQAADVLHLHDEHDNGWGRRAI